MAKETALCHPIEQPPGPPSVEPVDAGEVDRYRRGVYESYEQFLRQQLQALDRRRPEQWHRDYTSIERYERSIAPMRRRLAQMLGFWTEPATRPLPRVCGRTLIREGEQFSAYRFELEVLGELRTYGVEMVPKSAPPHLGLLVQHGYGGTPELICGLARTSNDADYSYRSLGLRAVCRGFHVVAILHPTSFGSDEDVTLVPPPGYEDQSFCYGKNRLHRLALMAGGTLFGLDMLASSRGVDLLCHTSGVDSGRIGMYGLSQGGQSALFLPAIDTRIAASVSAAYFNRRINKLIGPHRAKCYLDSHEEDKFFSEVIGCFSDSDIVSLIAPRAFAVEAGIGDGSVDFEQAREEFAAAQEHYQRMGIPQRTEFIAHREGHISGTARAFEFLIAQLKGD